MVGFPGHVLVKYNEEIIIDPFSGGIRLGIDDLQDILDRSFDGQVDFLDYSNHHHPRKNHTGEKDIRLSLR